MLSRVVRVGRTLRSSGVLTRATRSLSVTAGGFPPLPTIDQAKAMPRHLSQVSGENLFVLTEQGNANAIREQLRREIMAVDGMEYEETTVRLREMSALVASNHAMYMAPFSALIGSAAIGGFASLPLVFSFTCASWFNHHFVTADPPELGETDTLLEVGSWSWNWMEPPLGTISFFLLCVQYVREKRLETGQMGAMAEWIRDRQGKLLANDYGDRYDRGVLYKYGSSVAFVADEDEIDEEHAWIESRLKLIGKGS